MGVDCFLVYPLLGFTGFTKVLPGIVALEVSRRKCWGEMSEWRVYPKGLV